MTSHFQNQVCAPPSEKSWIRHCAAANAGNLCPTYREAWQRRGLLEDDSHWDMTLQEASVSQVPYLLRRLFAIMLHNCDLSSPPTLWMNHRESLFEDILHRHRQQNRNMSLDFDNTIFNQALIMIEDVVLSLGGKTLDEYGLPKPDRRQATTPIESLRETSYNTRELAQFVAENEPKLVDDQKAAYNRIIDSAKKTRGGLFFLDAPGGTGNTFVINLLLATVRQNKCIALAVASSGIAATLLTGGRTANSVFKLPLNLSLAEAPTCNISKGTALAEVLRQCRLIVWDECTMSHKAAFEALGKTLQDIRGNKSLMADVTFVMAGDFRQTLPVVPRGTRADEMQASVKSSYLWRRFTKLSLSTNMRVHLHGDRWDEIFSERLLLLGNGKVMPDPHGQITMKAIGTVVKTEEEVRNKVFLNIQQHFRDHKWLCERAILAPKNDAVGQINSTLLQKIPGPVQLYKSIDTVVDTSEAVQYPVEFLNSLELPGVPQHRLELKLGASIILLRILDPPKLCNGTRLVVKQLLPRSNHHHRECQRRGRLHTKNPNQAFRSPFRIQAASVSCASQLCHDNQQGSRAVPQDCWPQPYHTLLLSWSALRGVLKGRLSKQPLRPCTRGKDPKYCLS